jgi:hypothetical protein
MVAGDLNPRRAAGLQNHLAGCISCRDLATELKSLRSWSAGMGGLEELAPEGYHSVRHAVRARLADSRHTVPVSLWRPVWPVLAPLAGVLMMAGLLVLGGGRSNVPVMPVLAAGEAHVTTIKMSPLEDATDAMLSIQNGPDAIHQVAVSSHDPLFANAQVFQVVGDRWIDPTPGPEAGQVIFYRVD